MEPTLEKRPDKTRQEKTREKAREDKRRLKTPSQGKVSKVRYGSVW